MNVKDHYDNHLGSIYSWMSGDFRSRADEFKAFLTAHSIFPASNKTAIDLGSGHGIQSIPLAELGFKVIAVDFNEKLLTELRTNSKDLNITPINDDIRSVRHFAETPELIICCGDTLTHLQSKDDIRNLIAEISNSLDKNGKLILSFRDYSAALKGPGRFIPVKSDDTKILTCILDYEKDYVNVTDLLYEKINDRWHQKVSTYQKVRVSADEIISFLKSNGLKVLFNKINNGLTNIIAVRD